MALKAPSSTHQRKQEIVFDPAQKKHDSYGQQNQRKRKVAAYARVSTEQDAQQNSYEAQIGYYTDYIQSKPEWTFVKVYSDEGISGTSYKHREGFNQMVADAKAGKIDLILTKSISRFARNTVDSLTITRELKANGVEVQFEKENISSMDAQAELIFTIMSSIAQEESRSISENVRWGKQRSMEAGKVYVPYSCFLGYERGEDGLPKVVEEEAKIVRDIYMRYIRGETLNGIATYLEQASIPTPTGKGKWSSGTIRRILTNEKYKGDARLQKTYVEDFLTKKVKVNTGEHKQIYIHDSHDPIVTAETFELVQKELARRSGRNGRFHDSPFALKLICGECGNHYGHRIWHSNEPCRKEVWMCSAKYKDESICSTPAVTEQAVATAFVELANSISQQNEYGDLYEKRFLSSIGDTADLERQLKDVTNELNDAIDKIEKMIAENAHRSQDQDTYSEEFNKKNAEIDSLKQKTQFLQDKISTELARRENARIFLEGLRSINNNNPLTQFDVRIWHTLIDYATIMPDKTIIFRLRNGEDKTITLSETTKAV